MPRDVQSVFTSQLQPNEPVSVPNQKQPSTDLNLDSSSQEKNQASAPSPEQNVAAASPLPSQTDTQPSYQPQQEPPATQQSTDSVGQHNIPDQMGWQQAPMQPQPEYLLLEWVADSRVSQKRSKEYYSSLAVIVLLISLILFFAGQTLLIFVVWAFLFVSYVLASVKAEKVAHQVTTYGIRYRSEKLIYWEQLGRFWLRENHGHVEVHIEAPSIFGNELILLASENTAATDVKVQDIIDVFSRYLVYEEPIPSQLDRWVMWLQEKFPLE